MISSCTSVVVRCRRLAGVEGTGKATGCVQVDSGFGQPEYLSDALGVYYPLWKWARTTHSDAKLSRTCLPAAYRVEPSIRTSSRAWPTWISLSIRLRRILRSALRSVPGRMRNPGF